MKKYLLLLLLLMPVFVVSQNHNQKEKTIQIDSLAADSAVTGKKLIIGYKISPPFTMEGENNQCKGVSMELWKNIARKLNLKYEMKRYNLVDLLAAIESGDIDLCISPLTVTSERLRRFEFTQPFYTSNLAIAAKKTPKEQVLKFLRNFFSLNFFSAVFFLFIVIFIFGALIWWVEKDKNTSMFDHGWRGVGHGIWWSAVTMTTVGYGDKAPKSVAGRVLSIIWMFTSIIIISSFTGSIAASLTVQSSSYQIENVNDLKNFKTSTIKGSISEKVLLTAGVDYQKADTIENELLKIANDKIDAFLYDEPIIKYLVKTKRLEDDVEIVKQERDAQYYSFALPKNHPLHDRLNIQLINELESLDWKAILNDYHIGN